MKGDSRPASPFLGQKEIPEMVSERQRHPGKHGLYFCEVLPVTSVFCGLCCMFVIIGSFTITALIVTLTVFRSLGL